MLEAIKMYFLPCLINMAAVIYIQGKILNKKIIYIRINVYFYIIVFVILCIINTIFMENYLRIATISIIDCCFISILFKEKINITIISTLIQQILLFTVEVFYMLLFSYFNINIFDYGNESFWGALIINIIISISAVIFINIKYILNFSNKLFDILKNVNDFWKYLVLILFMITLNVLLMTIYFTNVNRAIIIINTIFIFIYSIIIYFLINERSININFIKENKILISNLNEYEKMLDYQRVNNHENKNQLLVIKSMVEKKNNNIIEYIDEIIKEKREDNEIIYNKAKRIPSGGLQGLIYQKMLLMQERNVDVKLDINSQVRKIDFSNLSSKMNYDICRVAGIIIDNAIEETVKFNKKEREIIISMYIDEEFVIEVSNRIKNDVDLSKIYESGYTSKEKGHGYGLSLLKKIVNENDKINNEVKIINSIFTQIIKIKM